MRKFSLISLIAVSSIALEACASSPDQAPPELRGTAATAQSTPGQAAPYRLAEMTREERFENWKQGFIQRAINTGYDPALVNAVIGPAQINERAIELNESQPEFTNPIWNYVDNAMSARRLNDGRAKLSEEQNTFSAIESRYQVPRHFLTAIWGLESAYGDILGTHDTVDSLATFAFEGRRTSFGEQQLYAVLDLIRDGYVEPEEWVGSWAGAVGMTQFIPTTFRDYGIDFDNDGHKDLWGNASDALGSAANYLSRHGWRWGEPAIAEVNLPDGFDYSTADGTRKTVTQWTALGVAPAAADRWSDGAGFLEAKLLVPAGHQGPKFLTFKNFDVIKRYNNSTSYALGISALAMALNGESAVRANWPRDDEPLSRTDKEELQRKLTALGFDTQGVDGQIGPNSRKAIRAWQKANGRVADGYVEQELLQVILAQ